MALSWRADDGPLLVVDRIFLGLLVRNPIVKEIKPPTPLCKISWWIKKRNKLSEVDSSDETVLIL